MGNEQYIQYLRKCITRSSSVTIAQIVSKLRKKFHLTDPEAKNEIELLKKEQILIETPNNTFKFNIFANEIRKRIYDLISQYPGIFIGHIKKFLNIGPNHVNYHLGELETLNLIQPHIFGNLKAYSLPNITRKEVEIGIFLLRININKIFQVFIQKNNLELSENEIISHIDIPRSTIAYSLKKLISHNLIKKDKKKKEKIKYWLNKEHYSKIQNAINSLNSLGFSLKIS